MRGAPFRHIGGAVLADHGPLSLAEAAELAEFYRCEADHAGGQAGLVCRQRARALADAAAQARLWRRAAGWSEPAAADMPLRTRGREDRR